jgi:V/A-type H+/Na+-transporting ATPase subunit E
MSQAENLEASLVAEALRLADEHLRSGQETRSRILAETRERLRQREERERVQAQLQAEKIRRQKIQAAEIRLAGELDRLRWTLCQSALGQVVERAGRLADEDGPPYLEVLRGYLEAGANAMPEGDLTVELCPRDYQRFAGPLLEMARTVVGAARVMTIAPLTLPACGGLVVRSNDNHVRLDNTFEGRFARLESKLCGLLMEKLFQEADSPS